MVLKNLNSDIGVEFKGRVSVSKTAGPGSNPGTPARASEGTQMLFLCKEKNQRKVLDNGQFYNFFAI